MLKELAWAQFWWNVTYYYLGLVLGLFAGGVLLAGVGILKLSRVARDFVELLEMQEKPIFPHR